VTRRLAQALCNFAIAALPRQRRVWGEAMRAELSWIPDGRSALAHAGGCIVAAAKARLSDFDTR